jgi:hypothetical protein
MLTLLTLVSWAALAYVFRAQIPVFYAAVVTDIAWVKSMFAKAPAAPAAPATPVAPAAPAAPTPPAAPQA